MEYICAIPRHPGHGLLTIDYGLYSYWTLDYFQYNCLINNDPIVMKRKLFIISVLIIGLFIQQISAQTTPVTQQSQPKAQQVPIKKYRTPYKKYIPKTKAQLPVNSQQTPVTATTAPTKVDTVKNTDFSLNGQYQFLLSRSRSINGYKLVNPFRLSAVWKSATDTLAKERIDLNKAKTKIAEQEKTIGNLQSEVKGNESIVSDTNAKIDEINFLGISFSKGTYNLIVWGIIVVLAISLFVVIARSAKNIMEAKHRTQLYDEITAEFQTYKSKASEKERKLARELQDERNIVEELKSSRKS
jgi:hypothetical protein